MVAPTANAAHLFNGCGTQDLAPSPGTSAATVEVHDFSYRDTASDGMITQISAGDSVTWTWVSPYCHSVSRDRVIHQQIDNRLPHDEFNTFTGDGLDEPSGADDSFTATFTMAGIYLYSCQHHANKRDASNDFQGMRGIVIVSE